MDAKKIWEEYILSNWKKNARQGKAASLDEMKRELAAQMADEEYGEALGTVAAMIEAGLQDADAFYDAAYSYFMSGDYERATEWVDNTLRFAPQHVGARILLARICLLEERTADGKGEWRLRPKLVVEAHRYYFLLPWAAGEVLTHSFPEDVYAVPSGSSAQSAATYSFDSSGDPSGTSALGHTIELQSPHYSLDVIIDEAGRVRTESRRLP